MAIPVYESGKEDSFYNSMVDLMIMLINQYSHETIHGYISECERLLARVQNCNDALRESGYSDSEGFSEDTAQRDRQFDAMSEVAKVSSEYYEYIATLPADVRSLLLMMGKTYPDQDEVLPPEVNEELRRLAAIAPSIQGVRPRNYVMPIDPITNKLAQLKEFNEVTVARKKNLTVQTAVTLDCPEHMRIYGDFTLTNYDKSIINGVVSILESGNRNFTIPMLYHAMTGKENPTVDEITFEELKWKLDTMRKLSIHIDLTEEVQAHLIDRQINGDIESFSIEGYLLPLNKYSGVINGKRSEMYQIIDTPPLHSYAKLKKQIASVSIDLLKAPLNNTSTTIPLKTYLLGRIEAMKNENNSVSRDKILFASIYRELGAGEADKKKKKRIRDYTEIVLTHFASMDYIQKYQMIKEGRTITAVRIYWDKSGREAV